MGENNALLERKHFLSRQVLQEADQLYKVGNGMYFNISLPSYHLSFIIPYSRSTRQHKVELKQPSSWPILLAGLSVRKRKS